MVNMFREEEEEETSEVLTEEEERTKVNTKDIMKIVEATIIIKKTGKEVEVVIRNSRKK
jgi:phosphotransferase system HPr-like phosphotransfer protein